LCVLVHSHREVFDIGRPLFSLFKDDKEGRD